MLLEGCDFMADENISDFEMSEEELDELIMNLPRILKELEQVNTLLDYRSEVR
jgi:Asp-tRNA(Asn)/Glu-tRNA(Gln) amidotransferase C subunit